MDSNDDDPLSRAMQPPKDETPEGRIRRIQEEQEALRTSQEIDNELSRERAENKKNRPEIKVLLLGPSGSGKSTTLKNFQLAFTPKALQAEATKYTALIFLNVVTSVRFLCDVLDEQDLEGPELTFLRECRVRLKPVIDLEATLAGWFHGSSLYHPRVPTAFSPMPERNRRKSYELTTNALGDTSPLGAIQSSSTLRSGKIGIDGVSFSEGREGVRRVLAEHRKDIEVIAQHSVIKNVLAARNQRLEHLPGFFLNDLERITTLDYTPTDDDALRTRIRTLAVSETRFKLESGSEKGQTWVITDVGGSRHQRAAWVPYFDDVNAIIFMAPIGDFDQFLEEDRSVNCLKDCLDVWQLIVSNVLLQRVDIILLLNKYDILAEKLDAGVQFSEFVTSYKDRNTAEHVGRYLSRKFAAIHKQCSPPNGPFFPDRGFHSHFTSVTDKSSTLALIAYLRYTILRNNLGQTRLL